MCTQCELVHINGIPCHETGCPISYQDTIRECNWCGVNFNPSDQHQTECSHTCQVLYAGFDCECNECTEWSGQ